MPEASRFSFRLHLNNVKFEGCLVTWCILWLSCRSIHSVPCWWIRARNRHVECTLTCGRAGLARVILTLDARPRTRVFIPGGFVEPRDQRTSTCPHYRDTISAGDGVSRLFTCEDFIVVVRLPQVLWDVSSKLWYRDYFLPFRIFAIA